MRSRNRKRRIRQRGSYRAGPVLRPGPLLIPQCLSRFREDLFWAAGRIEAICSPGVTCSQIPVVLVPGKAEEAKIMSVQREPALARARERYDGYRTSRPKHSGDRCGHRLLSVVPAVVSMRVEGWYGGRCLLCGTTTGPARGNGEDARRVLLEQMVGDEQQPLPGERVASLFTRAGITLNCQRDSTYTG